MKFIARIVLLALVTMQLLQPVSPSMAAAGEVIPLSGNQRIEANQSADPGIQCSIGTLYQFLNQFVDAQRLLEAGVAQYQAGPDADSQPAAMCMVWLGLLRQSVGDLNGALEVFEPALQIFRAENDPQLEWAMLYNTASIAMAQGRYDDGVARFDEALELVRQPGSWIPPRIQELAEAATLNNIGSSALLMGDAAVAEQNISAARERFRALAAEPVPESSAGADTIEPVLLLELVRLVDDLALGSGGDLEENPLRLFELFSLIAAIQAQSGSEQAPESTPAPAEGDAPSDPLEDFLDLLAGTPEADVLPPGDMGLGDMQQFLELLELLEDPASLQPETIIGQMIGQDQLQDLDRLVLESSRALEPVIVNNLGEVARTQGDYARAQIYYQESLTLISDLRAAELEFLTDFYFLYSEAIVLNNQGLAYYNEQRLDEALTAYDLALEQFRAGEQRVGIASVQVNRGAVLDEQGEREAALEAFLEALDILEQVRAIGDNNLTTVSVGEGAAASSSYALNGSLNQMVDIYNYAIRLAYDLGRTSDDPQRRQELYGLAFELSERSRSRLFLDLLRSSQLDRNDPELADLLLQERRAFVVRQATADLLSQTRALDPADSLLPSLQDQADQAAAAYDAVIAEIERRNSRLAAQIVGNEPVLGVEDVQQLLDESMTLVSYYTYDERVFGAEAALAFVLSRDSFDVLPLPEATAERLQTIPDDLKRSWLSSMPDAEHPTILQDLYQALIEPLEAANVLQNDLLGIVPHQELHYVPFSALSDGTSYVDDEYALFVLPSASSLELVQANSQAASANQSASALILGNPQVDKRFDLSRLQYAQAEAQQIGELFNSESFTGAAASVDRFRQESESATLIHIAAHGIYDSENPLDSAIYLAPGNSGAGPIEVRDIFGLQLLRNELVVLSACETNIGRISNGDEVVGLTRAFFTAGSPGIVSTLWQIDDEATSQFMVAFYRYWQEQGMSKAAALQAARQELRADGDSPYLWGAFVLNGDPGAGEQQFEVTAPATATPTTAPATATAELPTSTLEPTEAAALAPTTVTAVVEEPADNPESGPANNNGGGCAAPLAITALALIGVVLVRRRN